MAQTKAANGTFTGVTAGAILPGHTPASTLMMATGDAMDNIFDVMVGWPSGLDNDAPIAAASYRCKDFNVPQAKTNTHNVTWHGVTVKKVSSGIKLDREQKLSFRYDANYALYMRFKAWKRITGDVNTSGVANTESALGWFAVVAPGQEYNSQSFYDMITNNTDDSGDNIMINDMKNIRLLYWILNSAQVVDVGSPKFQNKGDGSEMWYDVSFIYGDMADPFESATGKSAS